MKSFLPHQIKPNAGINPINAIIPQRSLASVGKASSKTPPKSGAKENPTVWLSPEKPIYRPRQAGGADSATTDDEIGENVTSPAVMMATEINAQLKFWTHPRDR